MEGILGKHILGGASVHIKVLDSSPIPQQRNSCTEGIWGQYPLSMLGRTLVCLVLNLSLRRIWKHIHCPEVSPETLSRAVFWSILMKDQRHFTFFVHSFNHIKCFQTKVEWCCATLSLYRETPVVIIISICIPLYNPLTYRTM